MSRTGGTWQGVPGICPQPALRRLSSRGCQSAMKRLFPLNSMVLDFLWASPRKGHRQYHGQLVGPYQFMGIRFCKGSIVRPLLSPHMAMSFGLTRNVDRSSSGPCNLWRSRFLGFHPRFRKLWPVLVRIKRVCLQDGCTQPSNMAVADSIRP